jgi:uncharacterized membrane protein
MNSVDFIKMASKVGIVILILGIGLAFAGFLGFFVESDAANKPTIISGLVIGAVGYILVASQNILAEDF